MFARLFLVFVAVSLLEIFVFIQVGSIFGPWVTISLVILTALIGSALVRSQGIQLIQELQQRLAQGEMPGLQLVEGIMLLMTGVLLVTPGFVTDFCGLLLLQPAIRKSMAGFALKHIKFNPNVSMSGFGGQAHQSDPFNQNKCTNDDVIEGEFERKDKNRDK